MYASPQGCSGSAHEGRRTWSPWRSCSSQPHWSASAARSIGPYRDMLRRRQAPLPPRRRPQAPLPCLGRTLSMGFGPNARSRRSLRSLQSIRNGSQSRCSTVKRDAIAPGCAKATWRSSSPSPPDPRRTSTLDATFPSPCSSTERAESAPFRRAMQAFDSSPSSQGAQTSYADASAFDSEQPTTRMLRRTSRRAPSRRSFVQTLCPSLP